MQWIIHGSQYCIVAVDFSDTRRRLGGNSLTITGMRPSMLGKPTGWPCLRGVGT